MEKNDEIKIILTENELKKVRDIATRRNLDKRRRGIPDRKYDKKQTSLDIEIVGAEGEMAVAKWLGLPYEYQDIVYGDDGYDILTPLGMKIEVKRRKKCGNSYPMKIERASDFRADIGVLVYSGNERGEYIIYGWTSKIHFAFNCHEADYGYGKHLVIEPSDMLPSQLLKDAVLQGLI